MGVREVRVRMPQVIVAMAVAVPRSGRDRFIVLMLVVFVMLMLMGVLDRFMHVEMLVPLRDVQPDADRHEHCRNGELQR